MNNLPKLQTGDIVFFSNNLPISEAIKYFTSSNYSHVGIVVKNWGVPFVNEASFSGIHGMGADARLLGANITIVRLGSEFMPKESTLAIKANSHIGVTTYDFKSLFITYPYYLATGNWLFDEDSIGNKYAKLLCSEYAGLCLGIPDSYKISPQELFTKSLHKFKGKIIFDGVVKKLQTTEY